MIRTPVADAMRTQVRAADLILNAAEAGGLPMPFHVCAIGADLTLQFSTLDALTTWAIWADDVIADSAGQGTTVHHDVRTTLLDHPVRLTAITRGGRP